jgi:hypothetical protein
MDKNKFWLGGRLFNTASPRLVAQMQPKARPQVGRPNATQGTFASWAPQRTSVTQTQGTSTCPQVWRPNAMQGTSASSAPKRNTRRVRKMGAQTKNSSAMKTSTQGSTRLIRPHQGWPPQRNARHVRKMGAQMQHKACPQVGHQCNATHVRNTNRRPVRTSTSWAPQRNASHVCKMVAQTQNSSATKTSTQGSTRLKDELLDG